MSFSSETGSVLRRVPSTRLAPIYARHDVASDKGPHILIEEICLDGGNTIASIFRFGEGVDYGEVVSDVAGQLKIATGNKSPVELEMAILEFIIQKYLANATPEEREKLAQVLREAGADFNRLGADIMTGVLAAGTLALLIREAGQKVVAQVVSKMLLRIAGRQVARQVGRTAAELAGLAIPILNVVMIGWTLVDLAGPAFRKTVPTVIEIALLRLEYGKEL